MDADTQPHIQITGRRRLDGELRVNGAKNAALPCLAAALLTDESSRLRRVPRIEDVGRFVEILAALGADTSDDSGAVVVVPSAIGAVHGPPDELAGALRASFLVTGPLLARTGLARCGEPGGDDIGERPLDVLLNGFRAFGADVQTCGGRTVARAPRGLRGADLVLDYPSVLGTEGLLLAAVLALGRTRIANAAMEPEIICLAEMLNAMGARISGAGQHTITIDGVERLAGVDHELIPDRIETGTLLFAAAITRGRISLRGVRPDHLASPLAKLTAMGLRVRCAGDVIELVSEADAVLRPTNVQALPYPGFATDLQPLVTALLTQADGASTVRERVFEKRMGHIAPLRQLGAKLVADGAVATMRGPSPLSGAVVHGEDIRASAALVLASLAAEGQSRVFGVQHLERGYAELGAQLRSLGAVIERIPAASKLDDQTPRPDATD